MTVSLRRVVGKPKTAGEIREMLSKFRNLAKEIHTELDKLTDEQLTAVIGARGMNSNGLAKFEMELNSTITLLELGKTDATTSVKKQLERLRTVVNVAYDAKFIGSER